MLTLIPHPSTPCPWIASFTASVSDNGPDFLLLECELRGPHVDRIKMPDLDDESPSWVEGLWRTTCFELFVGEPDGHHVEFNFAPDGNWAAYAFSGRRSGMQPITITPGGSRFQPNCDGTLAEFWANIDRRVLPPGEDRLGICAVLEDDEGRISYWALAHPPGKPDFHHPDCFAVKLAEVLQQ